MAEFCVEFADFIGDLGFSVLNELFEDVSDDGDRLVGLFMVEVDPCDGNVVVVGKSLLQVINRDGSIALRFQIWYREMKYARIVFPTPAVELVADLKTGRDAYDHLDTKGHRNLLSSSFGKSDQPATTLQFRLGGVQMCHLALSRNSNPTAT